MVEWSLAEFWAVLMHCLNKHRPQLLLLHPGSASGPGHPCLPWLSLLLSHGCPTYSAALLLGVSGAAVFAWLRLWLYKAVVGSSTAIRADLSLLCLESRHACMHEHMFLTSGVQPSHSPLVSSKGSPTSQGVLSPICSAPGLGNPIFGSHHSLLMSGELCILLFPLNPFPEAQVLTRSLFFLLPLHRYHSYSLSCTGILLPVSRQF